ncbi:MAG: hypothetical protein KKI08_11020 [Armatimonadetes bacterium]|nr:hypothetical protein [Armatimonadota bacterium]
MLRKSLACLPLLLWGLSAATGAANVWLLDMGAPTSPLWPGFARVTPESAYSAEAGLGWVTPAAELRAYTGENLDALALDSVRGTRSNKATFRLDLPNGDYTVWLLSGEMGNIWQLRYLRQAHDLLLQDQVVQTIAPPEEELFRLANYDWRLGDDIFGTFIAPRFTWLRHDVTVTDGKLLIGMNPAIAFPLNAIVVAERGVATRVADQLHALDGQRREVFNQFWRENEPAPDAPAPVSEAERQRGYVVAEAHCSADLNPWSQPEPADSRERLELFATPGAQEQASFAVYAQRDLQDVTFTVSDLKSDGGQTLPASALRLGLVQFLPWKAGAQEYSLQECLILPLRPTFIGGGTCKRFWLTFAIPENTAPGVYSGRINVTVANAPPAALQLRLRVVPVKLKTPPFERYMYFGTMYYLGKAYLPQFDEQKYWDAMRAEVRFMRDNEYCRAECLISPDEIKMDGDKIADITLADTTKLMQICREEHALPRDNAMICRADFLVLRLGGKYPRGDRDIRFVPDDRREEFIRAVKMVNDKAEAAGWPEVAFEALGEYTNFGEAGAQFGLAVHQAFREARVSNTLRGNGSSDMAAILKGLVMYPQPNSAMMKTEWLDFMQQHSKRLWAYNFTRSRFSMGWFCFKQGITRASYESGVYANGQPGNVFEIDNMFPMGLPTSMTTIEPTVWLKRLVQGAVDYEYLVNLDARIRAAQKSGKPPAMKVAAEARKWLDQKLGELPNGIDYIYWDPKLDHDVQGKDWPVRDLDQYRWQAADFLMRLDQAGVKAP